MSRIAGAFERLGQSGRKAFIPYIMAGDPNLAETERTVGMLVEAGADIIELGVPFSDPVADGPVIQRAAERAIAAGVTLRDVIALVARLRATTQVPIVLMTYYNPIFKFGLAEFARAASEAGVDGTIIPDLPPDEAVEYMAEARPCGIDTIFLAAPNTSTARRKIVAKASRGFIYYVSITGITGSALKTDEALRAALGATKKAAGGLPVCLGFGVSTPEEAAEVAALADGVIIGSALVRRMGSAAGSDGEREFKGFLQALRAAI